MKRAGSLISALLVTFTVCGQTDDEKDREYYNNGNHMIYVRNYKGAIYEFTEAIARDSGFIQAYENRGVAKYYLKDYSGAIDDFNRALEINPNDYNTYGRRGYAKFKTEDLTGAIEDFRQALEGVRNEAEYHNMMGLAKYYLLEYSSAISEFNKVIRFWSGTREQRSVAFYWRGLTRIDMGQREEGCLDLGKARKLGYSRALKLLEIYCR